MTGPDTEPNDGTSGSESGGMDRRTLVRLLVGAGIGVPLAVEARTLYGLATQSLGGTEETGDGDDSEPAATGTSDPDSVGVGDELLPRTPPAETVTSAAVEAGGGWTFALAVEVDNATGTAYELRIEAVETDGERIGRTATTGRVPPNGSATLTGRWPVPEGSTPTALAAVGVTDPAGAAERVARTVPLDNVPVRRES